MKRRDSWLQLINSACDKYKKIFLTQSLFENILNELVAHSDSPVKRICFELSLRQPFHGFTISTSAEVDEAETELYTHSLKDQLDSTCRIKVWNKPDIAETAPVFQGGELKEALTGLIDCFWKPEIRDEKSGIPAFTINAAYEVADNSIEYFLQDHMGLCVFFCDLDHFKMVNDTLGMQTGDRVIRTFSAILDESVRPNGVAVHRSGDEFIILLPTQSDEEALHLAFRFMKTVETYDFDTGDVKIGVSAGITILRQSEEIVSYKELENRAEKAVKPGQAVKHRGKVRFEHEEGVSSYPPLNEHSMKLAQCIIKTKALLSNPFESPWLNLISSCMYDVMQSTDKPGTLREQINTLIDWISPNMENNILRSACTQDSPVDYSPVFSAPDIALAAAHGYIRCLSLRGDPLALEKELILSYGCAERKSCPCRIKVVPDDSIIFSSGKQGLVDVDFNLGGIPLCSVSENLTPATLPRALLIKIGYQEISLPKWLFSEIIIIDHRPTESGGLPDFWEATIARLIAHVEGNPNIAAVYVVGDRKFGAKTLSKLADVSSWKSQADQIAYKTGMPVQSIRTAAARIEGKVHIVDSDIELVSHLHEILRVSSVLQDVAQPNIACRHQRHLTFDMRMEGKALGKNDGCRVKTVAEAYPVVLEIARNAREQAIIVDQAGQQLRELIDFKVNLANPCTDLVPEFYENERGSLEDYFNREFLDDNGLFGRVLKRTAQVDAVLEHLAKAIDNPSRQFATRRAILVIPHDITDGEDISPLGLISVRIVPRFMRPHIILHYSFTWRTVEAFVGFPYSLYGSVRYGEHLTAQIQRLLKHDYSKQIEMGEVSYIAHSLHMFIDDYGQNIARRIVYDAVI